MFLQSKSILKKINQGFNIKPWFLSFKNIIDTIIFKRIFKKMFKYSFKYNIESFIQTSISVYFYDYSLNNLSVKISYLKNKVIFLGRNKVKYDILMKIFYFRFKFMLHFFFNKNFLFNSQRNKYSWWSKKSELFFTSSFRFKYLKRNNKKNKILYISFYRLNLLKIKKLLIFWLKNLILKFGSVQNFKLLLSDKPSLSFLQSSTFMQILLLIFSSTLSIKQNWYNLHYLRIINRIFKNLNILKPFTKGFKHILFFFKNKNKNLDKNFYKKKPKIFFIKYMLKWLIKSNSVLFLKKNILELLLFIKFDWIKFFNQKIFIKRPFKRFLWRLWQFYCMQFSLGKNYYFKNLYKKILKKYKLLRKFKFNIYVEDKHRLLTQFPNFAKNIKLKSNRIELITPIKLPKHKGKWFWKFKFQNNKYFKSVIFWKFFFKPFYFWLIYFFNIFFLKYLQVLFNLWLRFFFKLNTFFNVKKIFNFI